jgi:hypothetical protein
MIPRSATPMGQPFFMREYPVFSTNIDDIDIKKVFISRRKYEVNIFHYQIFLK